MRTGNERTGCSNIVVQVAAGEKIEAGMMVALNADGYGIPAKKETGLRIAGVAQDLSDNRLGEDGKEIVPVRRGAFVMDNDKSIKETDLLKTAYMADATTVTLTADGSSPVGTILEVSTDGVTVQIG